MACWQPLGSDLHGRDLVLHFAHCDGQAHARSTTNDLGQDDGRADGRKPSVLSALQSRAIWTWRPWEHATGPRTREGKARSSRNADRNGGQHAPCATYCDRSGLHSTRTSSRRGQASASAIRPRDQAAGLSDAAGNAAAAALNPRVDSAPAVGAARRSEPTPHLDQGEGCTPSSGFGHVRLGLQS